MRNWGWRSLCPSDLQAALPGLWRVAGLCGSSRFHGSRKKGEKLPEWTQSFQIFSGRRLVLEKQDLIRGWRWLVGCGHRNEGSFTARGSSSPGESTVALHEWAVIGHADVTWVPTWVCRASPRMRSWFSRTSPECLFFPFSVITRGRPGRGGAEGQHWWWYPEPTPSRGF